MQSSLLLYVIILGGGLLILLLGLFLGLRMARTGSSEPSGSAGGDEELLGQGNPDQFKPALISGLERMLASPLDDQFYIIAADHYYVQYVRNDGPDSVYCEAVGGEYLPEGEAGERGYDFAFRGMGFTIPGEGETGPGNNYSKVYTVSAGDVNGVIEEAIHIFNDVYGIGPDARIAVTLNA